MKEEDMAATSGRPRPGGEAVMPQATSLLLGLTKYSTASFAKSLAAVLHGQAGPALLDIPITMNGTRSDCSLYAAGLCPVRLPHGSRRRGATLIDYGAVTMGYRYTARRPYSARQRTSRRCSPRS